ncbi:MAG: hypothetical protein WCJ92_07965 [Alphaproteobacteria bacterium]
MEIINNEAKINRFETILDKKVEELASLVDRMAVQTKATSLEVTELTVVKESFKEEIRKAIQNNMMGLAHTLSTPLTDDLNKYLKAQLGSLQTFHDTVTRTMRSFKGLTLKMLGFLIFVSAIVGAASFTTCFYFIDGNKAQQVLTMEQKQLMVFGQLLENNFSKLSPDCKKIIIDDFRSQKK